jgi:hypothetical protein
MTGGNKQSLYDLGHILQNLFFVFEWDATAISLELKALLQPLQKVN